MATKFRNFGKGAVPTSTNTIAAAIDPGKSALISSILFVNRNPSASANVKVYLSRSSNDTLVMDQTIASSTRSLWTTPIALNASDSLKGLSNNSQVDYIISGVEKDL